jgi:hypothetical protein
LTVDKGSAGTIATFKGSTRTFRIYGDDDAIYLASDTSLATAIGINETSDKILLYTGNAPRIELGSTGNLAVDTNTLFVDAANNRVGVGTASPAFGAGNGLEIEQAGITTLRLQNTSGSNAFELQVDSAANGVLYRGYNASPHLFYVNNAEAMRLDTSGNLGLGVTPSASTIAQFEGGSNLILVGRGNVYASNNATFDSSWKYIGAAAAAQYNISGAEHRWFTAPSGTAGNAITFTQAMTLDASGYLLVNGTQQYTRVTIKGSAGVSNGYGILGATASTGCYFGAISATANDDFEIWNERNGYLRFATNNTERARITSGGDVGIGTASPGQKLEVAGRQRLSGSAVGNVIENRVTVISVSTTAVTVLDDAGSLGRLCIVNGESGGDRFCDLVMTSTAAVPVVVQSFTALGTPAARTYTRSGSALQVAMASGTYGVHVLSLGY